MSLWRSVFLCVAFFCSSFGPAACNEAPDHETSIAPRMHAVGSGVIAVSPSGDLVVVPVIGAPSNELLVVNTNTLETLLVRHPNRDVLLDHPTFSHDGRRLMFVAMPQPNAESAIWIVELDRSRAEVVREAPFHLYMFPSFSPDGVRIAYFRDVGVEPSQGHEEQLRQHWRENGRVVVGAPFEFNLTTGEERRLDHLAFAFPCGLHYAPDDSGWFLCARGALEDIGPSRGLGADVWAMPNWSSLYDAANFFLPRGGSLGERPSAYAPVEGPTRGAVLLAIVEDGRVLLYLPHAGYDESSRFALALWSPERGLEVIARDFGNRPSISADGSTLAYELPSDTTSNGQLELAIIRAGVPGRTIHYERAEHSEIWELVAR
jgi:hypothetical protein